MESVKTVTTEYQFFSVKKPVAFGGKSYRPSICYKLTADIFDTVSMLVADGRAVLYEKSVRFVSGKVREDALATAADGPVLIAPSASVAVAAAQDAKETVPEVVPSRKRSSSASGTQEAAAPEVSTGEFVERT